MPIVDLLSKLRENAERGWGIELFRKEACRIGILRSMSATLRSRLYELCAELLEKL